MINISEYYIDAGFSQCAEQAIFCILIFYVMCFSQNAENSLLFRWLRYWQLVSYLFVDYSANHLRNEPEILISFFGAFRFLFSVCFVGQF